VTGRMPAWNLRSTSATKSQRTWSWLRHWQRHPGPLLLAGRRRGAVRAASGDRGPDRRRHPANAVTTTSPPIIATVALAGSHLQQARGVRPHDGLDVSRRQNRTRGPELRAYALSHGPASPSQPECQYPENDAAQDGEPHPDSWCCPPLVPPTVTLLLQLPVHVRTPAGDRPQIEDPSHALVPIDSERFVTLPTSWARRSFVPVPHPGWLSSFATSRRNREDRRSDDTRAC
jgi:hypothetical protein